MRCLALANGLREAGFECHFVCREHPGHLGERVLEEGHALTLLPTADGPPDASERVETPYAHWLAVSWQHDAVQTHQALVGKPWDWLVVDHYALDGQWEGQLRSAAKRLMVIDDLANRSHVCDLLFDQNLGRMAADYAGLLPVGTTFLLGPRYALLRPEFAALREPSLARRQCPRLQHILVTMGGVDKDNATGRVLATLRDAPLPVDTRLTVVMGAQSPWLRAVRGQAATMSWPTDVVVDARDMAQLMLSCDLALGAAGATSWERCCLGVPSAVFVLAANQKEIAGALAACGAGRLLNLDRPEELLGFIQDCASQQVLLDLGHAASTVTDGAGVKRVVHALQEISFR